MEKSTRILDRFAAAFSGADADAVVHRQYKDLAVANFAGMASFENRVDGGFDELFVYRDLQLDFPQQIHTEFVSSIDSGLAFLPSKPLAIHHGQTKHLDFGQGFFDGFKPTRLDNGDNQLHG